MSNNKTFLHGTSLHCDEMFQRKKEEWKLGVIANVKERETLTCMVTVVKGTKSSIVLKYLISQSMKKKSRLQQMKGRMKSFDLSFIYFRVHADVMSEIFFDAAGTFDALKPNKGRRSSGNSKVKSITRNYSNP